MNLLPLVGFYWRRHADIETLVGSGKSDDGASHIVLDVLDANLPLIKRYFPKLNVNGLLDDALATLKEVLAPASTGNVPNSTPDSA